MIRDTSPVALQLPRTGNKTAMECASRLTSAPILSETELPLPARLLAERPALGFVGFELVGARDATGKVNEALI
jgi:hypothetical protein